MIITEIFDIPLHFVLPWTTMLTGYILGYFIGRDKTEYKFRLGIYLLVITLGYWSVYLISRLWS